MRTKKVLQELKEHIAVYCNNWREWAHNERCLLSSEEKHLIDSHIKNNFELSFTGSLFFFRKSQKIKFIIYKLKFDQKTFKEWMIETFLVRLIKIGELNNEKNYTTLIWELDVPQDLKESLTKFNTFTINEIFQKFKPEDFQMPVVYNKVLDTLAILKAIENNNDLKLKANKKENIPTV